MDRMYILTDSRRGGPILLYVSRGVAGGFGIRHIFGCPISFRLACAWESELNHRDIAQPSAAIEEFETADERRYIQMR